VALKLVTHQRHRPPAAPDANVPIHTADGQMPRQWRPTDAQFTINPFDSIR